MARWQASHRHRDGLDGVICHRRAPVLVSMEDADARIEPRAGLARSLFHRRQRKEVIDDRVARGSRLERLSAQWRVPRPEYPYWSRGPPHTSRSASPSCSLACSANRALSAGVVARPSNPSKTVRLVLMDLNFEHRITDTSRPPKQTGASDCFGLIGREECNSRKATM